MFVAAGAGSCREGSTSEVYAAEVRERVLQRLDCRCCARDCRPLIVLVWLRTPKKKAKREGARWKWTHDIGLRAVVQCALK